MNEKQLHEKITDASKTIFTYCMARTPTREDAEDLSQDILYQLLASVGNLKDENAFYGFMWAVAGNVYKQWCRKRRANQFCELTEEIPAEPDVYDFEQENEEIHLLRRELSLLSDKYRRATVLYYVDRKSCAEIAALLSISEGMVKYLLFKARKIVKEGMNMERKLGELSYNPKSLIPMYRGEGPNQFWDFMSSKLRQNIIGACYNDALTPQQISLETGIPMPYLEDEILALAEKEILIKDGPRYKTNVIVLTADCSRILSEVAVRYHAKIADAIDASLEDKLPEFTSIGFCGAESPAQSLKWMLATLVFRAIQQCDIGIESAQPPVTAWGERAYLYCVETEPSAPPTVWNYSTMGSKRGDGLYFYDYLPLPNGNHGDFWGNEMYINLFCDVAGGKTDGFGEYELEAIGEMIRMGYIIRGEASYRVATPVYTRAQYEQAQAIAEAIVQDTVLPCLQSLHADMLQVLNDHTPKHLVSQIPGIVSVEKFTHAVAAPTLLLTSDRRLDPSWLPGQMPTNFVVLSDGS